MAKISINDAGKFTGSASEYFTLKDDGDTARVRFLYNQPDGSDMDYFLVHVLEFENEEGKKFRRYVSCLAVDEEGRMHKDDCPLCKAGVKTQEKLYIQLYNEDEGKLMVWERGATFVGKIVSLLNRYGSLVERSIDIERRGKKGDRSTTYELYTNDKDGKKLTDFPEKVSIEGKYIVKATKSDMQDMLDGVYDWGGNNNNDNEPSTPPRKRERGRINRVDDAF